MKPVMKQRMLVLDDDPTYLKIIERQAAAMDIETIVCRTMDEFCLEALKGDFDVVAIDFHLDFFKGDNVARAIESKPVVLMSGDPNIGHAQGAWPTQVVGFVAKSHKPEAVINTIMSFAS